MSEATPKTNEQLLASVPDSVVQRAQMSKEQVRAELPAYMRQEQEQGEMEKDFFRGPVTRKFMQNPVAFVAIGVTVGFLGKAVVGSVNNASPRSINSNLRKRVMAQGFAIAAIVVGFLITKNADDRT